MELKPELNMGIIMQPGGQNLGGLSIYHFPFLETMTISFSNSDGNCSQIEVSCKFTKNSRKAGVPASKVHLLGEKRKQARKEPRKK